jgi:hypothetical protein
VLASHSKNNILFMWEGFLPPKSVIILLYALVQPGFVITIILFLYI